MQKVMETAVLMVLLAVLASYAVVMVPFIAGPAVIGLVVLTVLGVALGLLKVVVTGMAKFVRARFETRHSTYHSLVFLGVFVIVLVAHTVADKHGFNVQTLKHVAPFALVLAFLKSVVHWLDLKYGSPRWHRARFFIEMYVIAVLTLLLEGKELQRALLVPWITASMKLGWEMLCALMCSVNHHRHGHHHHGHHHRRTKCTCGCHDGMEVHCCKRKS